MKNSSHDEFATIISKFWKFKIDDVKKIIKWSDKSRKIGHVFR